MSIKGIPLPDGRISGQFLFGEEIPPSILVEFGYSLPEESEMRHPDLFSLGRDLSAAIQSVLRLSPPDLDVLSGVMSREYCLSLSRDLVTLGAIAIRKGIHGMVPEESIDAIRCNMNRDDEVSQRAYIAALVVPTRYILCRGDGEGEQIACLGPSISIVLGLREEGSKKVTRFLHLLVTSDHAIDMRIVDTADRPMLINEEMLRVMANPYYWYTNPVMCRMRQHPCLGARIYDEGGWLRSNDDANVA